MAYREIAMWEILEVLRRIDRGESRASVARVTGQTRKTIRRYVATAAELGWEPGPEEPTEALAAAVFARHRPSSDRSRAAFPSSPSGGSHSGSCPSWSVYFGPTHLGWLDETDFRIMDVKKRSRRRR